MATQAIDLVCITHETPGKLPSEWEQPYEADRGPAAKQVET